MTTVISYSDESDGRIRSSSNSYSTALAGGGSFDIDTTTNSFGSWGQSISGSTYNCYEYFVRFPHVVNSDERVVSAFFEFRGTSHSDNPGLNRNCEVREFNWGTAVGTSDWRSPSQLNGLTLLAEIVNGQAFSSGNRIRAGSVALVERLGSSGEVRVVVGSSRMRNQNSPSGGEVSQFWTTEATTTFQPELVYTTVARSELDKSIGAQAMLADGRTAFVEQVPGDSQYNVRLFDGNHGLRLTGASGSHASTPHHGDLDITGDIDLRIQAVSDTWHTSGTQYLVAKYDTSTDDRSYALLLDNGLLQMRWSEDGSAVLSESAESFLAVPTSRELAVRARLVVDDGDGKYVVTFYTAPSIEGPWTIFGESVEGSTTTSIFSGDADLIVGARDGGSADRFTGIVKAVEVREGTTGPAGADPRFLTRTAGETTFDDQAGRSWTVHSPATITNGRLSTIASLDESVASLRGSQSVAMCRDGNDNIYVFRANPAGGNNAVSARAFIRSGSSWTPGTLRTVTMSSSTTPVNNISCAWHGAGSSGTIVLLVNRVAGNNTGTPSSYALLNAGHLLTGSGSMFRDGPSQARGVFYRDVAPTGGFNNFDNETGTLQDLVAASAMRGYAITTTRLTTPQSSSGFTWNALLDLSPDGSGISVGGELTAGTTHVKDANAKIRAVSLSGDRFIMAAANSVTGWRVRLLQYNPGTSNINTLADLSVTAPSAPIDSLGRSHAWDMIVDQTETRLWLYYFDIADDRRLLRTSFSLPDFSRNDDEVEVASDVGDPGSENVALRVHRGATTGERVLVSVANVE